MKDYNQLTQATRYQIEILLKAGKSQKPLRNWSMCHPTRYAVNGNKHADVVTEASITLLRPYTADTLPIPTRGTRGSSFENITDEDVEAVMHKLNHRPRKTLNYQTPYAVFFVEAGQEAA